MAGKILKRVIFNGPFSLSVTAEIKADFFKKQA
jgi:hypothetical protein